MPYLYLWLTRLRPVLEWLTVVFLFMAAGFWWISARPPLANLDTVQRLRSRSSHGCGALPGRRYDFNDIPQTAHGKGYSGPSMTLGNGAAARVRFVVWGLDCHHQIEPPRWLLGSPGTMTRFNAPRTAWRTRCLDNV
jgi:hypothetical protein